MRRGDISLLGYALMGMLSQKPSSGYDVRMHFVRSPMGSFSDSPGAIYPALQKLEQAGLIRGQIEEGAGMRRKKVFRLSTAGAAALKKWLRGPVTRADVVRGITGLMLRFTFMEGVVGEAATLRFLEAMQRELALYVAELRAYVGQNKSAMPRSSLLAMESGVHGYEGLLTWSKRAIASYEGKGKGERS